MLGCEPYDRRSIAQQLISGLSVDGSSGMLQRAAVSGLWSFECSRESVAVGSHSEPVASNQRSGIWVVFRGDHAETALAIRAGRTSVRLQSFQLYTFSRRTSCGAGRVLCSGARNIREGSDRTPVFEQPLSQQKVRGRDYAQKNGTRTTPRHPRPAANTPRDPAASPTSRLANQPPSLSGPICQVLPLIGPADLRSSVYAWVHKWPPFVGSTNSRHRIRCEASGSVCWVRPSLGPAVYAVWGALLLASLRLGFLHWGVALTDRAFA